MNVFLSHLSMDWIFYGVIIVLGLMVLVADLARGKFGSFVIGLGTFILVFWMHGGTMTGGMAAATAGLLGSVFIPPMVRWLIRRNK